MILKKVPHLKGTVNVPGDYSITQKAIAISSIAKGKSIIHGYLDSCSTNITTAAFRAFGIDISDHADPDNENVHSLYIYGNGLKGLSKPSGTINVENNSLLLRMLSGIIASQSYTCSISGDAFIKSLSQESLIKPLRKMGSKITGFDDSDRAPLTITGRELKGIQYVNIVSNDEIKSAVLLAGLYAKNKTTVYETRANHNHMEVLLDQFGAQIEFEHTENTHGKNFCDSATVYNCFELNARDIYVPGDFFYASCFISAALINPDCDIYLTNVGVNSTRIAYLNACIQMGGNIEIFNLKEVNGERIADLHIKTSELHALRIPAGSVTSMIDELPLLCLIASKANGTTIISGLTDIKEKDVDLLKYTLINLNNMGANISIEGECLLIKGLNKLRAADIITNNDHRLNMAMCIAGISSEQGISVPGSKSDGWTYLEDYSSIEYYYPEFLNDLASLI